MTFTRLIAVFAACAVLSGLGAAGVAAHKGATGVVKERMDGMKALQGAMKSVGQMIRGQAAYDSAAVMEAADRMQAHSGQAMTALFPENSLASPSEATGAIWQNWSDFEIKAGALEAAAGTLKLAASADRGAVRAAFGQVAQTCKACHEKYREKKD